MKKWLKIVLHPTFNLFFVTFCQKTKENIADFKKKAMGFLADRCLDMQKEFPESKNFSVRNLWYMKQWFLFYTENIGKLKQLVSEMLPSEEYKRKLEQIELPTQEQLKERMELLQKELRATKRLMKKSSE